MSDPVQHPKHYNGHPSGVECIQITEHMGFCLGNAIKYIWRADLKNNAIEDLEKAIWYIQRELEKRRGEQVNDEVAEAAEDALFAQLGTKFALEFLVENNTTNRQLLLSIGYYIDTPELKIGQEWLHIDGDKIQTRYRPVEGVPIISNEDFTQIVFQKLKKHD